MYFAAAGAWVASLPSRRWKVSQPVLRQVGFVAEADTVTRPASAKAAPVASVSPEKSGPMTPTIESSLMIWVASGVAFSGSPCESNSLSSTLQSLSCVVLVEGDLGAVDDVQAEVRVVTGLAGRGTRG